MTDIDRDAIRARIEHCKAYRFGMIGVIARQDAPDLLAALEDAERERDEALEAYEAWKADGQNLHQALLDIWHMVEPGDTKHMTFGQDPNSVTASVRAERDALAAVVERVRALAVSTRRGVGYRVSGDHDTWGALHEGRCDLGDEIESLLDAAPTAALEAVKAEAWDEGVDRAYSSMIMRQNAADVKRTNPHRTADTKEAH